MQSIKVLPRHLTDRKSKLIIGVVAGLYLLAIPFLFYAYRLVPVEMTEAEFMGIKISAGAHGNLNYYA
ncbi:MAG TPA: hypothetical protein ENH60_10610, partial [Pricia sp.]|nr:hypothetical protein [Pricia sp.]